MSAPQSLSTAEQAWTLRTRRGNLTVGPHGKLDGLWRIVKRELRSNAEVRAMCKGVSRRGGKILEADQPVQRATLIYWRKHSEFPAPVVELDGTEYWSRTMVEAWIEDREAADLEADLAR